MLLTKEVGVFQLITDVYRLTFLPDRPYVYLDDAKGKRLAELFVLSSIHPLNGRDDTVQIGPWEAAEGQEVICLSIKAGSSIWQSKIYRFHCYPTRFLYEIEVEGLGQLSEVNYFGGYSSSQIRWGSGFFWSGQRFQRGFNPNPNSDELNYFMPAEGSHIDLMGVPLPGKADWFFTPPPFCFAFEGSNGWLGMGVESRPGGNRYTEFSYHAKQSCFYSSLSFEGHTTVQGSYLLPGIGFEFSGSEYGALSAHVKSVREVERVAAPARPGKAPWWYEPIFCGWGEQCYLASINHGNAPDYSRQSAYEDFLATLEEYGVMPGTVVLDDKWQAAYGDNQADANKWPDLPGFICRQHLAGRKVLLWLKAWDPEGVPVEECITNAGGFPLSVDPSNPVYEERLRRSIRRMLSPEGYDADGFKIDFTARIPSGPGILKAGDSWGLELMKLYLKIIYEEAKKTKPDALIMTHTPHPYLADVTDMIRLNDMNMGKDINQAMTLRARVAATACPDAIIDTDNWPITNRATWRKYLKLQLDLGVPSLYYAKHIDSTGEALEEQDYRLIRETWRRYRARLQAHAGPVNDQLAVPPVHVAPVTRRRGALHGAG